MDELALIIEVNELFEPFYPYVARQIAKAYGRSNGSALEIGPYAPGVSIQLAKSYPDLEIIVGDSTPGILEYFHEKIKEAGLRGEIKVQELDKTQLPFADRTFDLVYFRGALFFWEEQAKILQEAYRVLNRGGVALLGGGFGAETPDELINSLLDKSRELNRRLRKKVLSEVELQKILKEANLSGRSYVDRRHGLWVACRKIE